MIYYTSDRKEQAVTELETVQPMVNRASRPDCLRTRFLLGTLYREMSRPADADHILREFMLNTQDSTDPEILSFRQQLEK